MFAIGTSAESRKNFRELFPACFACPEVWISLLATPLLPDQLDLFLGQNDRSTDSFSEIEPSCPPADGGDRAADGLCGSGGVKHLTYSKTVRDLLQLQPRGLP